MIINCIVLPGSLAQQRMYQGDKGLSRVQQRASTRNLMRSQAMGLYENGEQEVKVIKIYTMHVT